MKEGEGEMIWEQGTFLRKEQMSEGGERALGVWLQPEGKKAAGSGEGLCRRVPSLERPKFLVESFMKHKGKSK